MKTIKSILIISLTILSFSSCKKGGVFCHKGNGEIKTESRELTGFSSIDLNTSANIYYTQADEYSVIIECSENILEIIETRVSGTELDIDIKSNACLINNNPIDIYISTPDIRKFSISGSGDIIAEGLITTNDLDISINGSGDITIDSLKTEDISATISGSGNMNISGVDTASYQDVKISGSGNIKALGFPVKHSKIKISGSGDCKVNAIETLDVKITGSGNVIYKGNPIIDTDISGSGSLNHY